MTVYDVNITVNSPDLEKDTDNIINIARSCNVEIEVEIENPVIKVLLFPDWMKIKIR